MKPRRLLFLFSALALPLHAQVTTTLLNDTFADLDHTNSAPPDSSEWLSSATNIPANIDASGGALVTKSNLAALTYFTAADAPATLAVGGSLTLTFNVSFSTIANAAGNFRVGFYDSGTRLSNGFGNANAAFSDDYAGYLAVANVGATSGSILRAYERSANNLLIGSSISNFSQVGASSAGAFKTFVAGTVYSATITLARTTESSLSITQTYTGDFAGGSGTVTGTIIDTSAPSVSFDTLAFYYNVADNTVTLDNIKLDYVSPVPEPASTALLLGTATLAAGILVRRPRAA